MRSTCSSSSRLTRSALVVRHHVEQRGRLGRGHRPDNPHLALGVEVAEDLGPEPRWEQVEDRVPLAGLEVLDHLGDVGGVLIAEEIAQRRCLAGLDQLAQVGHQQRISHSAPPFVPVLSRGFGRVNESDAQQ